MRVVRVVPSRPSWPAARAATRTPPSRSTPRTTASYYFGSSASNRVYAPAQRFCPLRTRARRGGAVLGGRRTRPPSWAIRRCLGRCVTCFLNSGVDAWCNSSTPQHAVLAGTSPAVSSPPGHEGRPNHSASAAFFASAYLAARRTRPGRLHRRFGNGVAHALRPMTYRRRPFALLTEQLLRAPVPPSARLGVVSPRTGLCHPLVTEMAARRGFSR